MVEENNGRRSGSTKGVVPRCVESISKRYRQVVSFWASQPLGKLKLDKEYRSA